MTGREYCQKDNCEPYIMCLLADIKGWGDCNPLSVSRRRELNPRPADYESAAMPLSHGGAIPHNIGAYGKKICVSGIPSQGRNLLGALWLLRGGYRSKLGLVVSHSLCKDAEQVFCMGWCNRYNGLGPCLVNLRKLVQEHERELVILVGDLYHVAVYRVKSRRNIYGNFLSCHADQIGCTGMKYVGQFFRVYAASPEQRRAIQ
jgi:hypothetical protein